MDCNARFEGEAYLAHTVCVSEAERYQGALYVHKENKGEVKQEAWSTSVQSKVENASAELRPYAQRLLAYDNVPRKRAKFINFAKNSLNLKHDPKGVAEQLWDLVGEAPPAQATAASAEALAAAEAKAKAKAAEEAAAAVAAKAAKERLEAKDAAKKAEGPATSSGAFGASERKRKRTEDEQDKALPRAEAPDPDGDRRHAAADPNSMKTIGPGKRRKGEPQPVIDTATKAIKWKTIITKELAAAGGQMSQKKLRKAVVAEVQAHPSYAGREAKQLKAEFDQILPTFNKYTIADGKISIAAASQ